MKKSKLLGLYLFIVFLGFLIFLVIFLPQNESIILKGNPAVKFCTEKCLENTNTFLEEAYVSSINDTEKEIIMCECALEKIEPMGKTQLTGISTVIFYFNSSTFEELDRDFYSGPLAHP